MNSSLAALAPLLWLAAACAAQPLDEPGVIALDVGDSRMSDLEGLAHGFPALRTLDGQPLGDGEFSQWLEGDRLHILIHYGLGPDRWIEERSVVHQRPKLVQEQWSWVETRAGSVHRRFQMDFLTGNAVAEKQGKDGMRRWSKRLDVEPGRVFAGSCWALAVRSVRDRLMRGETIEFQAVAFRPNPTAGKVEISYQGLDRLPMAGRTFAGDRFKIHGRIPWIVRPFIEVPDSFLWLTSPPPAAFLRFEGPLAEPDDQVIRVDLLPGDPSGAAAPASTSPIRGAARSRERTPRTPTPVGALRAQGGTRLASCTGAGAMAPATGPRAGAAWEFENSAARQR